MFNTHTELKRIEKLVQQVSHYDSMGHYSTCLRLIEQARELLDSVAILIKKKKEKENE